MALALSIRPSNSSWKALTPSCLMSASKRQLTSASLSVAIAWWTFQVAEHRRSG